MKAPNSRSRRWVILAVSPIAIVAAGLLVWQASSAAFTAQTRNIGNSWETGAVSLSDDDLGAAGFQITKVVPGQTGTHCITVTSTSSTPGVVKMYLTRVGAQGLENNVIITLESGTGGSFINCLGFVPDAAPEPAVSLAIAGTMTYDYATGTLPWTTTGAAAGESKSYRVTWLFDTAGLSQTEVDALQGKSASADVVWELRSN